MTRFLALSLLALILAAPLRAGSAYDQTLPEDMPAEARALMTEAISKAYTRLFNDESVQTCIRKNTRVDYVDPKVVTRIHGKPYLDAGRLFKDQMDILHQHAAGGAKLPPITIKMGIDRGFAAAWARLGTAHVTRDAAIHRVYWHGAFEVTVNIIKLYDIPVDGWAGLLAHEMLHNLMHAHESADKVGIAQAYAGDILINAAQNCITNAVDLRDYASTHRCGGREPKE